MYAGNGSCSQGRTPSLAQQRCTWPAVGRCQVLGAARSTLHAVRCYGSLCYPSSGRVRLAPGLRTGAQELKVIDLRCQRHTSFFKTFLNKYRWQNLIR